MTWRSPSTWAAALALGSALAVSGLLYQRTLSVDLRAPAEMKELLQRVRQLDSDLGKGVLASRYGLVNQYDALTRSNSELDASRIELRSHLGDTLTRDQRTAGTVQRLEQAELRLRGDVERFKTENSVLKNSLFYLPLAGASLAKKLAAEPSGKWSELQRSVEALVRSTLVYNLLRTDTLRDSLLSQQNELAASTKEIPEALRPDLTQFLRHTRTIVRQEELVDPLVARISSGTLAPSVSELEALGDEILEREGTRVNRYRLALTALVVLLLGLLAFIGCKLKRLYASLERQVLERTQKLANEKVALEQAERVARLNETRINAIIHGAREGIVRLGPDGRVRSWNPAADQMFDVPWPQAKGAFFVEFAVPPEAQRGFLAWLSRADTDGRIDAADYWHELPFVSASRRVFAAECSVARRDPALDDETTLFVRDVSQAKQLEAELRQAQKLESVGRLASGIAHEINTPIQFVSDSCFFIGEALTATFLLLGRYAELLSKSVPEASRASVLAEAANLEEQADLPYLLASAPKSLATMVDGLSRVAELVSGMKAFAHPDLKGQALVDLNGALKSTLIIARSEYKYVADLTTDLADLPTVMCHGGEINQVILNIIVNAAHAIADRVRGTDQRGRICVRTRVDGESVVISISDTGGGIPSAVQGRIFDPFFTTKEVGRGTGQGLAIARIVVVEKHAGELNFETELGKGTTFHIRLPIAGRSREARSAA